MTYFDWQSTGFGYGVRKKRHIATTIEYRSSMLPQNGGIGGPRNFSWWFQEDLLILPRPFNASRPWHPQQKGYHKVWLRDQEVRKHQYHPPKTNAPENRNQKRKGVSQPPIFSGGYVSGMGLQPSRDQRLRHEYLLKQLLTEIPQTNETLRRFYILKVYWVYCNYRWWVSKRNIGILVSTRMIGDIFSHVDTFFFERDWKLKPPTR